MLESVQDLLIVEDMHERKRLMFEKADAFRRSAGRHRHAGGTGRATDLGAIAEARQASGHRQRRRILAAAARPARPYAPAGVHPVRNWRRAIWFATPSTRSCRRYRRLGARRGRRSANCARNCEGPQSFAISSFASSFAPVIGAKMKSSLEGRYKSMPDDILNSMRGLREDMRQRLLQSSEYRALEALDAAIDEIGAILQGAPPVSAPAPGASEIQIAPPQDAGQGRDSRRRETSRRRDVAPRPLRPRGRKRRPRAIKPSPLLSPRRSPPSWIPATALARRRPISRSATRISSDLSDVSRLG